MTRADTSSHDLFTQNLPLRGPLPRTVVDEGDLLRFRVVGGDVFPLKGLLPTIIRFSLPTNCQTANPQRLRVRLPGFRCSHVPPHGQCRNFSRSDCRPAAQLRRVTNVLGTWEANSPLSLNFDGINDRNTSAGHRLVCQGHTEGNLRVALVGVNSFLGVQTGGGDDVPTSRAKLICKQWIPVLKRKPYETRYHRMHPTRIRRASISYLIICPSP
ncbi:uncharacterized protein EV422DRAFT_518538 [Fimicolochytrium jonesii]|uniref:uncharacterized protein n=1 Tax=Fimicolochytrium jonesii TaxID=1396493 RepID=UPI0022FEADBC|nr:uncharacterized protein EV422DRAFT_518538 [Fimicolochytrium jonesii]KAI8823988.1 hypothetical protein EV422DRAFT_518538 [Fimicolochytrium jonesii]